MPRAAGNAGHYTFRLVNEDGRQVKPFVELQFPSVTTIIKRVLGGGEGLLQWYYRMGLVGVAAWTNGHRSAGVAEADDVVDVLTDPEWIAEELDRNRLTPRDVRDAAADRGTEAHSFFEAAAKLGGPKRAPQTPYEKAICDWWEANDFHVEAAEASLVSVQHRFAGTCDLIYWVGDELRLLDLKTRSATYRKALDSDLIQVAAYKLAWEEMTGMPITRTGILMAREDGKAVFDDREVSPDLFLKVKEVYEMLQGGE